MKGFYLFLLDTFHSFEDELGAEKSYRVLYLKLAVSILHTLYLSIAKEHSQRNQLEILGSIKLSYVTDMKKNPIVQRNLIIDNELRA